jgi:hypothetical protein
MVPLRTDIVANFDCREAQVCHVMEPVTLCVLPLGASEQSPTAVAGLPAAGCKKSPLG